MTFSCTLLRLAMPCAPQPTSASCTGKQVDLWWLRLARLHDPDTPFSGPSSNQLAGHIMASSVACECQQCCQGQGNWS